MSVLSEILAAKRARLSAGWDVPADAPGAPGDGQRFLTALRGGGTRVIAEIKGRSPSKGTLLPKAGGRVEDVARAYRRGGAAALSVVIEQDFFGGDPGWIPRAKAATGLPILMKDFVVDERQLDLAVALGADAVLLIVRALDGAALARLHAAARRRGLAVLVEAHDEDEARAALRAGAEIVGVNARDLSTFAVDMAAAGRILDALPPGVVRVAESGVKTRTDVESLGASGAFLVGEALVTSADPARLLRQLRGEGTTEVKICGVTREEDLAVCAEAGVDYVGFNFSPRSPRRLGLERASALREAARFAKGLVAVFAENSAAEVEAAVAAVEPDVIQRTDAPEGGDAHHIDPSSAARGPGRRPTIWQTVRVGRDVLSLAARWPGDALLFDTAVRGVSGGTGAAFDWSVLDGWSDPRPVVLAGGLTPANVASAVERLRPAVVDCASGVERSPGVKDRDLISAFVKEVRRVV